jgi:uncharacterized membrane protein YidH (DUF202 family)
VELGRIQGNGITIDLAGLTAWHGMELERNMGPSFSLQRLNTWAIFALVLLPSILVRNCEILAGDALADSATS